jgi:hypothetical protein
MQGAWGGCKRGKAEPRPARRILLFPRRRENRFYRRRFLITLVAGMNEYAPDLLALLSHARSLVPDDRRIWCSTSDTFDSRLQQRRGILLGGAFSPHFLRDATALGWEVPWLVRLRHCRVAICDRAAEQTVAAWLPLMEAIAGAGEALLVVTETIDPELLSTLAVNAFKGTLRVCVARPASGAASGARLSAPPKAPDQLMRIDDVLVRRTATVLFPATGEPLANSSALENIVVVETGGENHEDQRDRMRFLMQELQRPDRR